MRLCMTRNQKTMLCSVCSANDNYMRTQDHHTMGQFNEQLKGLALWVDTVHDLTPYHVIEMPVNGKGNVP